MKKIVCFLLVLMPFALAGCSANIQKEDYLRIHIRANSNSEADQKIKYFVKDIVVEYLNPYLAECKSKSDAIKAVNDNLPSLKQIVNFVLTDNGFEYACMGEVSNEFFPTKSYEELTLEAGYYDALVLKLGTGKGDNWWCVMYPNICFDELTNVVYKSKIKEIIQKVSGENYE